LMLQLTLQIKFGLVSLVTEEAAHAVHDATKFTSPIRTKPLPTHDCDETTTRSLKAHNGCRRARHEVHCCVRPCVVGGQCIDYTITI